MENQEPEKDFQQILTAIDAEVKEMNYRISELLELKADGEDISYEREDVKEQFDMLVDNYKDMLKNVPADKKESIQKSTGTKLTKLKTLLAKL